MNETNTDRKHNTTLIALWEAKTETGNILSMPVDARAFDQLQKAFEAVEMGGRMMVKKLPQKTRDKFKDPSRAPTHFLEFISADSVAEFESRNPRSHSRGGL